MKFKLNQKVRVGGLETVGVVKGCSDHPSGVRYDIEFFPGEMSVGFSEDWLEDAE